MVGSYKPLSRKKMITGTNYQNCRLPSYLYMARKIEEEEALLSNKSGKGGKKIYKKEKNQEKVPEAAGAIVDVVKASNNQENLSANSKPDITQEVKVQEQETIVINSNPEQIQQSPEEVATTKVDLTDDDSFVPFDENFSPDMLDSGATGSNKLFFI